MVTVAYKGKQITLTVKEKAVFEFVATCHLVGNKPGLLEMCEACGINAETLLTKIIPSVERKLRIVS